ncbi:hypothetical protein L1987_71911 [Smallanthus sonchifolius]|uniref:Uncharacterized protein n=1 Tax=Smallanthus sonchifolius TaxID=185202 RepID=A0ACB9AUK3_9ASTR|nr:hypothetical protein L1987_71911 [Smallanthus sonchifolius]
MHKIKGFRMRHKLVKIVRWGQKDSGYVILNRPNYTARAMSKLRWFARNLKNGAKGMCFRKPSSRHIHLGKKEKKSIPKGHLAVYVGGKEDDAHRVLVPVIYFNHPLFGDLLREAEKVYGFSYDGGIHVPCRISEFENVQTKINGDGYDRFRARRRWRLSL